MDDGMFERMLDEAKAAPTGLELDEQATGNRKTVLEKFVDDQYAMPNLPESHSAFEDKVMEKIWTSRHASPSG
jgi:hypothetical protein